MKEQITGVILAGGTGKRMGGKDKGLVNWQGKKLIEYVINNIEPQVDQLIINANRNIKDYQRYGFKTIQDKLSGYQGPLAGIVAAMEINTHDYLAVVPCDYPHLPNHWIDQLHQELKKNNAAIAYIKDYKKDHYLCTLIQNSLKNSLHNFLNCGYRKVADWFSKHQVVTITYESELLNINQMPQPSNSEKGIYSK